MSLLNRSIIAFALGLLIFYAILFILGSNKIVTLTGAERNRTIFDGVQTSMQENRFVFFSASGDGIENWLSAIASSALIETASVVSANNQVLFTSGVPRTETLEQKKQTLLGDQPTTRVQIPIEFDGSKNIRNFSHVELIVQTGQQSIRTNVLKTMAQVLLITTLLMIPILLLLSRWVSRPINHLSAQLQGIAPSDIKRNSLVLMPEAPKELMPVVDTTNSLLRNIQRHTDNLDLMVEQRTNMLNDAIISIQEAEKQKKALISNLSHDLKTPLSSIKGYLELVQEGINDNEYEYLDSNIERALSNSDKMLKEINTILNISAAELDGENSIKQFSIGDMCQRVVRSNELLTAQAGNTLVVNTEGDDIVGANQSTMRHAIDNLISNANKYTSNNIITLSVAAHNRITVRVSDQGAPIATDLLNKLFEPKRTQGSARFSLSGLGLYLCKVRIEAADGEIKARQRSPKGLEVTFTLPNMGS